MFGLNSLNGAIGEYLPYAAVFIAVVCAVYSVALLLTPNDRLRRLSPATAGLKPVTVRRAGPFERLLTARLGGKLAPSDARERSSLRLWLLQAGYCSPQAIQAYYSVRIFLAVVCGLGTMVVVPLAFSHEAAGTMLFSGGSIGAAIGFMLPISLVGRQRKSRQRIIRDGLPDILDLLLICTEAGLGLDMAIARVGEELVETYPMFSEHLQNISTELLTGRSRNDAMRAFADRTGVDEVNSLVNLLIQSDTLGTGMAQTLRAFSADMRSHRLLEAEEKAQKVTVKLSMILVGFFMPALISSIMAPIIFKIIATWRGIVI